MEIKISFLSKVSDWNSFRVNQNYSDLFRYLYSSQCESFRINPRNALYLVWWKTVKNQSDLIRLILRHQSEPIRNQVFNPDQSKSIRAPIDPNRIFNQNQSESFRPWIDSDWIGFIRVGVSELVGLSRIYFRPFFIKQNIKRF